MIKKNDVVVVDYRCGNLSSITRALTSLNLAYVVSTSPKDVLLAKRIILPGVGSFGRASQTLSETGLLQCLTESALSRNVPILGICLGMQLLGDSSEESDGRGLGLISGYTKRLNVPPQTDCRVPHIGWNTLERRCESPLFTNIPDNAEFYFVHSFRFFAKDPSDILASTHYGERFPSIVCRENIAGFQFHPEKSGRIGLQLLKNFLDN